MYKNIEYLKYRNEFKSDLFQAISEILVETDAHNKEQDIKALWDWRNEMLPSNMSLVYLAMHQGKIIGYYHIPIFYMLINGVKKKIGQIESVAVLAKYRSSGVFKKLAEYANENANKELDIIYTFPNHRSIHTFIKYNDFSKVETLPIYILPIDCIKIIESKVKLFGVHILFGSLANLYFKFFNKFDESVDKIIKIDQFDKKLLSLYKNFTNYYEFSLIKDKDFLNWRFLSRPDTCYKIIGLEKNSEIQAVIIYKEEVMFSNNCIVIMDLAFKKLDSLVKLMHGLPNFNTSLTGNKNSFILISGLIKNLSLLKRNGFIPIPKTLMPRKLTLLARWTKDKNNVFIKNSSNWLVTLCDWDVF